MTDDKLFWLAFSLVPQIGSVRMQHLRKIFGTLETAWGAADEQLRQSGLPEQSVRSILQGRKTLNLEAEWRKIERMGIEFLIWDDPAFPESLRNIQDAPSVLYVRGKLLPTDERALAIVGTRKASRYGIDAANYIAKEVAEHGVTIVSGLAHGIDAAAHQGALAAQGRTIAVLGNGIDRIYPADHQELAEKIAQNGAIISEYPLGSPPSGAHFPRRNRIISGLSLGVLIGEAPMRSGAIITAEAALEQGKEVFAIPANIFNQVGTGGNRLIQEGARLVMHPRDILEELNIAYMRQETRSKTVKLAPGSDAETQILNILEADPIHIDEVIRQTGLAAAEVIAALTLLE
ncbi:MAG: DNA-processing protein DprA [Anaerolineae bacterium]|nr:DNA-processing protein DprA [Anaerolineae bacterium]